MLEIHGMSESNFPQAFVRKVIVEPDFDTCFRALNEVQPPRTKHYKILRNENDNFDQFMLHVFNEAMIWKCRLIKVEVDAYCVDIEYTDL